MKLRSLALTALVLTAACAEDDSGILEPRANVVAPACNRPAPLLGNPDSRVADSYIVAYKDGTDAAAVTAQLEQKHGFKARFVYEHAIQGFAAELSAEAVARVRCEATVKYVEHDGVITAN